MVNDDCYQLHHAEANKLQKTMVRHREQDKRRLILHRKPKPPIPTTQEEETNDVQSHMPSKGRLDACQLSD